MILKRFRVFENNNDAIDIDLNINDIDIELKEDTLYSFLGIEFKINYSNSKNEYFTLLTHPERRDGGGDKHASWVLFSKDKKNLINKIRFNIKLFKEEIEK